MRWTGALLEAWTIWVCANVEIREGERIRKEIGEYKWGGGVLSCCFQELCPLDVWD